MILTVTLNTAIDLTLFIKDFQWGQTIRTSQSVMGMGGKATDASWILGELRIPNRAMGFAAGDKGRQIKKMLENRGSGTDFVWVKGETRTNIVIISESGKGQSTLVNGGLVIAEKDVAEFRKKYTRQLKKVQCVVIGGSVPAGIDPVIYTEMVREARQMGLPVVFDASGPGLKTGVAGQPTVAKPNVDEISDLAGYKITTIQQAYHAAKELQAKTSTNFIVTFGEKGALAVLTDRAYLIPALKIPVVSTAGVGDAVLAGMSVALSKGKPLEEGLRLGFAAAAAVCLTPATADCRREDVEAMLPRISLVPYQERS
jgi:1-phosphofructokinase family hexose kinase